MTLNTPKKVLGDNLCDFVKNTIHFHVVGYNQQKIILSAFLPIDGLAGPQVANLAEQPQFQLRQLPYSSPVNKTKSIHLHQNAQV